MSARLRCRRCGDGLADSLPGVGVHLICCDITCPEWPCDGAHLDPPWWRAEKDTTAETTEIPLPGLTVGDLETRVA